jgi:hypothetical protein
MTNTSFDPAFSGRHGQRDGRPADLVKPRTDRPMAAGIDAVAARPSGRRCQRSARAKALDQGAAGKRRAVAHGKNPRRIISTGAALGSISIVCYQDERQAWLQPLILR